MYKILFNGCTISTCEKEDAAIALSLNLHQVSNIPHEIIVQFENETIIYFKQYDISSTEES